MAKLLDKILVVDVESTCWKDQPPRGQESEIIEIGLCVLDTRTLRVEKSEAIFVRPEQSTVSEFCTQLTTITPEMAAKGRPFRDACQHLMKTYRSSERLWASYGDYDKKMFERNSRTKNCRYPFGPGHLNVKTLFAVAMNLNREVGMPQALEMLKIPLVGTHHRGEDDAINIAKILAELLGDHR